MAKSDRTVVWMVCREWCVISRRAVTKANITFALPEADKAVKASSWGGLRRFWKEHPFVELHQAERLRFAVALYNNSEAFPRLTSLTFRDIYIWFLRGTDRNTVRKWRKVSGRVEGGSPPTHPVADCRCEFSLSLDCFTDNSIVDLLWLCSPDRLWDLTNPNSDSPHIADRWNSRQNGARTRFSSKTFAGAENTCTGSSGAHCQVGDGEFADRIAQRESCCAPMKDR